MNQKFQHLINYKGGNHSYNDSLETLDLDKSVGKLNENKKATCLYLYGRLKTN